MSPGVLLPTNASNLPPEKIEDDSGEGSGELGGRGKEELQEQEQEQEVHIPTEVVIADIDLTDGDFDLDFSDLKGFFERFSCEKLPFDEPRVVKPDDSTFVELFASPTLHFIVGPNQKDFHLHKALLSRKCPYFSSLLTGSLSHLTIENSENTIRLDTDVDCEEAFSAFVAFLYHDVYDTGMQMTPDQKILFHTRVYTLAERFCMEDLKNIVVTKFRHDISNLKHTFKASTLLGAALLTYLNTPPQAYEFHNRALHSDIPTKDGLTANAVPAQLRRRTRYEPSQSKSDIARGTSPENKLRTLLANFGGSLLPQLRRHPAFGEIVATIPDFAFDLLQRVNPAPIAWAFDTE